MNKKLMTLDFWQNTVIYESKHSRLEHLPVMR